MRCRCNGKGVGVQVGVGTWRMRGAEAESGRDAEAWRDGRRWEARCPGTTEFLNPVRTTAPIDHIHGASRIDSDANNRQFELAISQTLAAPLGEIVTAYVKYLHPVVVDIGDLHVSVAVSG